MWCLGVLFCVTRVGVVGLIVGYWLDVLCCYRIGVVLCYRVTRLMNYYCVIKGA